MNQKISQIKKTAEKKTAKKSLTAKLTKSSMMMGNKTQIVTAALPYANGSIHIGHLLEYIQTDIYARYLRLIGKNVLYICASDMHGTPIEVNAKKLGLTPEAMVDKFWKEHQEDFASFLIKFDNYYKTHSPENKELAEWFFSELKKKNLIYRKKINVIYCTNCNRSLPDRFVRGTCPNCSTADQYGDVCESCGSALKGIDLINPKCSICSKTPVQKESEHYFFKLSSCTEKLKKWINDPKSNLQPEVKNWLKEWTDKKLEDWCVSRDEPYFGFEIPDSVKETGEKKFFYVWLDAPIGYISSTKNYCDKNNLNWEDYWYKGKVQHFIGKDISYFHFLFWPAMLIELGIPLPELTVHGFITINGQKMSKSRGTFFTAKDFLKLYSPESLRFYYAAHLDRKVIDVDLNFEDFKAMINNVLVGNLGNFCYRVLTFAEKNYTTVTEISKEEKLEKEILNRVEKIKQNYFEQDYKLVIKHLLMISDIGNNYFQKAEPWKTKEDKKTKAAVGWSVNLARNLAILVSPILPEFAKKITFALEEKELSLKDIKFSWKGKLKPLEMLVSKIDHIPKTSIFPLQLAVGQIKEVKDHPNADTLYILKVDLGKFGLRQVVAGLKKYQSKEALLNRKAVFCVNMKPAKLRGEISEAMILAAEDQVSVVPLDAVKTPIGEEVAFSGMENSTKEVTYEDFKQLVLLIKEEKVWYENKKLISKEEEILTKGVNDGARVY